MTGLRGSTLTYIVRELMEIGVVRIAGKRESRSVGQKQILLEINGKAGWTVGVDLRRDEALMLILDLAGSILDEHHASIPNHLPALPATLKGILEHRLLEIGSPQGHCLGIGVGVPGIVNVETGDVLISRELDCKDIPLGSLLKEHFDTAVLVDHNANLAALAESRSGAAADLTDFVYFLIHHKREHDRYLFDKAFGCAMYLDGKIHRGAHFAAGEVSDALQPSLTIVTITRSEFQSLTEADSPLSEATEKFAFDVGYTMAQLINLLDPDAVIVGADFPMLNKQFIDTLRKSAAIEVVPVHNRQVRILPNALGEAAIARGGAIAAAESALLDNPPSYAFT